MIRKGLEILKANRSREAEKLPSEIPFPPIYGLFAKYFELGEDGFDYDRYYLDTRGDFFYCQILYYGPRGKESDNITFTHFDDLVTVKNNWEKKLGYTEKEIDMNLLRIGGIALGGGLFVGTDQETDSIFLHIWDSAEGLIKLEDDIFSFASKLVLEPDEVLPGNVKHSQLYKNWGEDFWRVRPSGGGSR
jgi:hypothetical protein